MNLTVRALKNKASQQVFVLLKDDEVSRKMTIINPKGDTITVPPGLFDAPFELTSRDFESYLTKEQIKALSGKSTSSAKKPGSSQRSTTGTTKKKSSSAFAASSNRTGLGASWHSETLTFYKHQIEPLAPAQTFKIFLDDGRVFEISKDLFGREFNDVIIAESYWKEGSFAYPQIPEKAIKYLR